MAQFSLFMAHFADFVNVDYSVSLYHNNYLKIKSELENKLFNENNELYSDYLGQQWAPMLSK